MVNTNKLKGKIIENGLTVAELAKRMGIDKATLYRRLGCGETFLIGEAYNIAMELKLTPEETISIFFNQEIA